MNGLPLKNIIAITTTHEAPEFTRTTFRVLGGGNRKLEDRLHLSDEANPLLSSSELDGRIVAFTTDVLNGYEITIESQKPQSIRASPPFRGSSRRTSRSQLKRVA